MKSIKNFYNKNITKYSENYKKNGWGSKVTQTKRFEIFYEIGNLSNSKIIDLGCGTADLKKFLKSKKIKFKYTGLENNEKMIEILKKNKINYIKDSLFNLKKIKSNSYDYVFMSGAVNLPTKNHKKKIVELIRNSHRISKKATALNFLSTYSKKINENEFYFDPSMIFNVSKKLCSNVVLRHDYLPHDFTIILYKN